MEGSKSRFHAHTIVAVSILLQILFTANGQSISTPCMNAMLSTFTPCMNFLTGSTSTGGSPTADCCNSIKAVMEDSMDCACLLVTANVPLPSAINRSLFISLPKLCKSSGVSGLPIQCQASGTPLGAPGPALLGSPQSSSAFSPQASKAAALGPAEAPETPAFSPSATESPSDNESPSGTESPSDGEAPSTSPAKIRPVFSTSGSVRLYTNALHPVAFMLIFVGFMASWL